MLSPKNRINKKDIDQIFKNGKFLNSPNLTFKFFLNKTKNFPAFSFITPKTVSRSAVKRNLLRRRGYRAIKESINDFPTGMMGVFIFKKYQENVSIIKNEIKEILHKIN